MVFELGDEICKRLVDHRCFTSGELRYFVKHFDEIPKDRPELQLDAIEADVEEVSNCRIDLIKKTLDGCNLDLVEIKVDELLQKAHSIMDLENKRNVDREEKVNRQREKYNADKVKVIEEYAKMREEHAEAFLRKADELKTHYQEMESQWKKHS